jgi:hypothetical protein
MKIPFSCLTEVALMPRHLVLAFGLTVSLLSSTAAQAGPITISGAPTKGALPTMITAFTNTAGTDVLPAGATDYYVFTLFDTGATRVYFDSATAATLGVSNGMVTDVRINGLGAIDPVTLNAPIYAGQAQAEVAGVPVSVPAVGPDITLIGGPVTNDVKAVIDYTTLVTRGPYAYLGGADVSGPDIMFYSETATPSFMPAIELSLQAFGSTGPGLGQRYWMYDVGFNNGGSSVVSLASGDMSGTDMRFLYDTGTNVTLIRDIWASTLGLTGPADFNMIVDGSLLNGYYLDSITMTGVGGTYTVLGAPVLVTPGALGGSADAIIGSNLFASSRLLFDGPGSTLSIEGPSGSVPEQPATFVLLCTGLAALRAWRRRLG